MSPSFLKTSDFDSKTKYVHVLLLALIMSLTFFHHYFLFYAVRYAKLDTNHNDHPHPQRSPLLQKGVKYV